jgi:hypothetical protein
MHGKAIICRAENSKMIRSSFSRDVTEALVFGNGLYDLVCFASIMAYEVPVVNVFGKLHVNTFLLNEEKQNATIRRMLAYWILGYSTVRLLFPADTFWTDILAITSYALEAYVYLVETVVHRRLDPLKAAWIVFTSIGIALCILANMSLSS